MAGVSSQVRTAEDGARARHRARNRQEGDPAAREGRMEPEWLLLERVAQRRVGGDVVRRAAAIGVSAMLTVLLAGCPQQNPAPVPTRTPSGTVPSASARAS